MAFTRVHHVGLVTDDLERARQVLCVGFGLAIDEHRTPWPDGRRRTGDGATVLEVPIGELYYEVAKPDDDDSESAHFLAATNGRGGIQYIALASDDLTADLERLAQHGVQPLGQADADGAVALDPTTCLGLDVRLVVEDHYYVHPAYRGNGTATGMAHIGIAARSAREVRRLWGDVFGLREDPASERGLHRDAEPASRAQARGAAIDPVHLLEFPIGGTVIEVSIPTSPDSGTARLVAQRAPLGAVYHHTCPYTPDVYRFIDQAVAAGLQPIGELPPPGARELVVGWLHPRSCLGMLIEVWNRPPGPGHYQPHQHPV
jgi:catechol 2,3-dioxygenase-like lactoylglutathione lyase family enzyme